MQEDTSNTLDYKVKIGNFEGPLDLLLSLIEQRKLFINEISLSEVTNDYISYVKDLGEKANSSNYISNISYFILISATLILIKSKSLLPNLSLTEEETEKIVDLEKRLKLFNIIKSSSVEIEKIFGKEIIFLCEERDWSDPIFSPDKQISVDNIFNSVKDVINNLPKKTEKLPEIEVKKIINIEEVIDDLTGRIESAINLSFRDFVKNNKTEDFQENKVKVIVSFLAMLELVRGGIIDVIQNNSFDDIMINKQQDIFNNN
jgi:segregation and condensation protein A